MIDERGVLDVLGLLEGTGSGPIVAGGWGVDALIGRQTRPHQDLDVAIDGRRLDQAVAVLNEAGFSTAEDWLPIRLALRHDDGREVDLHPLAISEDGTGILPGFDGVTYRYPPEEITTGKIAGRPVRCISAALQVRFHDGYEPRDVDRADMALLHDAIGVELPSSFH